MFYTISMLLVVMIGFGTIVWRIRSAEQAEEQNGDAGNTGNDAPHNGEGAYSYTMRSNDSHRGNGRMRYQAVKVYSRR